MQEFSVPVIEPVGDKENLTDVIWENAERHGDAISIRRRVGGTWEDLTAAGFAAEVISVARGLVAAGVEAGARVAIQSKTRYEWTLFDYAIWTAGATTVPIYETSSAEQVEWILADSGATALVVETASHRQVAQQLVERLPELRHIWQLEAGTGEERTAVEDLVAAGESVDEAAVRERAAAVGADDLATLIYTSGTTGRPKGCELTHRNLLAEIRAAIDAFPQLLSDERSVLLFLPLAHVFARVIQCCSVYARVTLGHTPDVRDLLGDLAAFKPSFVLSVPRVFEKVYNGAKQKAHAGGKGRIFDAAETVAIDWSRSQDTGGPGLGLKLQHALFDRLVYGKLRDALGGECIGAVSGGAPLGERLGHFFRGIGLPVLEGYGLTETTAAATANTEDHLRVGSVGRPVAGVGIRIADDGEILIKGDVVFRGYWHNPDATAESMVDGWFRTGDLGKLDDEGYLSITGRKKEIIVTAGGKNVAPAVLEDRLRAHPLVSQCMVVGDQKPFVAALITIDGEALTEWSRSHGKPDGSTPADLVDDADLRAEMDAAVKDANLAVSAAEAIKEFRILPGDFTEDGGELTPTLKLKRAVVMERYAKDVEAIYA